MSEPEPQKVSLQLIKTTRQWLGLLIVLIGAVVLLLESVAVFVK